MRDFLKDDIAMYERGSAGGAALMAGAIALPDVGPRDLRVQRETTRKPQELAAGEPIDIFHWAAVALVTALMCAVLGYAAGTPALARAANITSLVFGVAGGALTASGIARRLRTRLSAAVADTR